MVKCPNCPEWMILDDDSAHWFVEYMRSVRCLTLRVEGEKLMVSPAGLLLPDDAELIRLNKPLIMEVLAWEASVKDNEEIDDAVRVIEARI